MTAHEKSAQQTVLEERNGQGAEEKGNLAGVTAEDSQHWVPTSMASGQTNGIDTGGGNGNTGAIESWVNASTTALSCNSSGSTLDNMDGTGGTVSKNWSAFTCDVGRIAAFAKS